MNRRTLASEVNPTPTDGNEECGRIISVYRSNDKLDGSDRSSRSHDTELIECSGYYHDTELIECSGFYQPVSSFRREETVISDTDSLKANNSHLELIDLKDLQIAKQKEMIDSLSSQLSQSQVELEAISAEKASLIGELLRAREDTL